jgi:4-hydroxybenzoate polyprenyltransferase
MTSYARTFEHTSATGTAFLKAYVVTMRPYLMFVSGITGIAALSIVPAIETGRVLSVALASFLSYGFGQALTDCFQTDTDSLSAPCRPLIQGIVTTKQVLTLSIAGLLGCVLIFSFYCPINLLLGLAGGIGLATYTPFKRLWWAGPFYNAWIVGVLFVIAFLAGGGDAATILSRKFMFAAAVVFFGYTNFVLSGYFKDIEADRFTGYNTFPVRFGRRFSSFACDVLALLTLAPVGLLIASTRSMTNLWSLVFIAPGTVALMFGQVRLHFIRSDSQAFRAIVPILHSYLLLLSGIALLEKPAWGIPLALFYAGFLFTMYCRPTERQI